MFTSFKKHTGKSWQTSYLEELWYFVEFLSYPRYQHNTRNNQAKEKNTEYTILVDVEFLQVGQVWQISEEPTLSLFSSRILISQIAYRTRLSEVSD